MENIFNWTGRCDGNKPSNLRIHQIVNQNIDRAAYVLVGFCSDEGVKRNHGRIGAALAPDQIRKQLASLPVHQMISLQDQGNIYCHDTNLEQAQEQLSTKLVSILEQGSAPIVLGGGHEVSYGSFKGLFDYIQQAEPNKTIGIINFDAHFDLRDEEVSTSGTSFSQAAKLVKSYGKDFKYICLGVAKHSNTKKLFEIADQLNCSYLYDYEISDLSNTWIFDQIQKFIDQVDYLYITVDLDVFSASIAPGVSAPAVRGINVECFDKVFSFIQSSGKIRLLDIAECNPNYDIDQHTAKLAAYIVFNYIFD